MAVSNDDNTINIVLVIIITIIITIIRVAIAAHVIIRSNIHSLKIDDKLNRQYKTTPRAAAGAPRSTRNLSNRIRTRIAYYFLLCLRQRRTSKTTPCKL